MIGFRLGMLAVFALTAGTAQSASSAWEIYPGINGPGHAGILIGDFNADGRQEAAVSGYSSPGLSVAGMQLLAVLAADSSGSYAVESISTFPTQSFAGHFKLAPHEGGADRIVSILGSGNGAQNQIAVLGGVPIRVLRTIPAPNIYNVAGVADVDADGDLEVVALTGVPWGDQYPVILDYATGAIEWVGSDSATDIGIAQLDEDSALELILASTPGRVLDGASGSTEWLWPGGFGERVLVGQFDIDPATPAFATAERWAGYIQIFRGMPYSPVTQIKVDEVDALAVVSMGGYDQIGVGSGQWGDVTIHDPRSGAIVFSAANPEYGVSALAGGDLDGDAGVELVYGAGLSSSGPDLLRVIDSGTNQDEYYRLNEMGPHSTLVRGDLVGGGSDQIAYVSYMPGSIYYGSTLRIVDSEIGSILRSREQVAGARSGGVSRIAISQLDGDPQAEIILGFDVVQTPTIAVVDSVSLSEQWRRSGFDLSSATISGLDVLDVNDDGVPDIVLALSTGRVHVLNGLNGASIWQSVTIAGTIPPSLDVFTSASGDPKIVMGRGQGVYVMDPVAGLVTPTTLAAANIKAIKHWKVDDSCEIGALDQLDWLTVYDCADLGVIRQLQMPFGTRFFRPMDAHATRFIAAADHVLYEVQANRQAAVVSGVLGNQAGAGNQGSVTPSPDGKSADVVIGSMHVVMRLRVETEDLFAHGFE